MVTRTKPEPATLVVLFERDGEVIERAHAKDGRQAVLRAASIVISLGSLQAGDKLFVLTVDDDAGDDARDEDRS
jgi:hypothetical protein